MDLAPPSSPDPLNDTPTFSSPAKFHATRSRKSLPLQGNSPTKQTFQLDIGDQLSPQKIRVTVETEPPAEKSGRRVVGKKDVIQKKPFHMPPVRQNIRTTTTTIPLKGLSDSEDNTINSHEHPPKRGRGRPRKSTGTPVPSKARVRTVTPAGKQSPRRRRTLGDLVDGDDSQDWDFTIGESVEISRGKGRSRSRSVKGAIRGETASAAKQRSSLDNAGSSATRRTSRGRRKTLTAEEILIHEDNSPKAVLEEEMHSESISGGVLASRHGNTVPVQSAFSTFRSTTTVGNDDPDILLAKFVPQNETLVKTGWSSPSVVHDPHREIASSRLSRVVLPSLSPSVPENGSLCGNDSCEVENADMNQFGFEGEAEVVGGDFQESDTILESEGFSMISVDSVPSLREHISSPPGLSQSDDGKKPTAPNERLERLRTMHAAQEDSFSSIASEILEAATPRRGSFKQNLLNVRPAKDSGDGDSFSSISSKVLLAATPGKPLLHPHYLASKLNASSKANDSFSSIPSAVLEAATPAKHWNIKAGHLNKLQIPEPVPKAVEKLTSVANAMALERSIHNSSGLATPDETPSPTDDASSKVHHQANQTLFKPTSTKAESTDSSVVYSQLKSSPPSAAPRRFTYTAHLRRKQLLRPGLVQTPSIVFSSPSLPPLIPNVLVNRKSESTVAESGEAGKEKLSPIVRAGRALQDMTTSPSRRSRSESLGSPFKSPSADRNLPEASKNVARAVEISERSEKSATDGKSIGDKLFGGFSNDTRRELRRSMAIGEEHAIIRDVTRNVTEQPNIARSDDPFIYGRDRLRPSTSGEKQSYKLGLPRQDAIAYPTLVDISVNGDSFRSEGAMSWQAENPTQFDVSSINARNCAHRPFQNKKSHPETNRPRETTELLERRREVEWARERARVSSAIESASTSQVIVISSDAPSPETHTDVDDLEEDIWQAEARDSSALSEEPARKNRAEKQAVEKPRRSKIPSPWRQNSKRLTYSDELVQPSSPSQPANVSIPVNKSKPKPIKASIAKRSLAQPPVDEELPDSSIVWHIPQKMNFAPKPRNYGDLGLSTLLASPPLNLPQLSPRKPPPSRLLPLRLPRNRRAGEQSSQGKIQLSAPQKPFVNDVDNSNDGPKAESESESDSDSDVFHTPPSTRSSQESYIRTSAGTPTKSAALASPTPSLPRLSCTEWTRDHWLLIQKKYEEAKSLPESPFQDKSRQIPGVPISWDPKGWVSRDEIERVTGQKPSKMIGRMLRRRTDNKTTHVLIATKWHIDIVGEFMAEAPGWDEIYVARRLLAILIGEEMRRLGTRHLVKRKRGVQRGEEKAKEKAGAEEEKEK